MADSSFKPIADPIYVHPLSVPIQVGTGLISEIAIRKPVSMDLVGIGNPVISDPTSFKEAKIDYPVAFQMVSALSNISVNALYKAELADLVDLFWKVGSFFIPGWEWVLPEMQKSKDQPNEPSEQPDA